MAASLKDRQLVSGFWPVNLDDPVHCKAVPNCTDAPETSGTAFFTYAIAWGINKGHLDNATYRPVVEKAWNAMVAKAVHPNGKLGWVQGVGENPESSQPVTYESTADFGVGAFLLAGSEVVKMAGGPPPQLPGSDIYVSASDFSEVVELGSNHTGVITAEFDVEPQRNRIDGVVCFADSSVTISGYSSCAMLIRMYTNGVFEVRNGATYRADATVPYNARNTYHVRMLTDLDAQTYDVYVTAPGAAEVQIANDYAFRSDAPLTDSLGQLCLKSGADGDYLLKDLLID
jgi:hypothetical protein